jgi:hypothetical protein
VRKPWWYETSSQALKAGFMAIPGVVSKALQALKADLMAIPGVVSQTVETLKVPLVFTAGAATVGVVAGTSLFTNTGVLFSATPPPDLSGPENFVAATEALDEVRASLQSGLHYNSPQDFLYIAPPGYEGTVYHLTEGMGAGGRATLSDGNQANDHIGQMTQSALETIAQKANVDVNKLIDAYQKGAADYVHDMQSGGFPVDPQRVMESALDSALNFLTHPNNQIVHSVPLHEWGFMNGVGAVAAVMSAAALATTWNQTNKLEKARLFAQIGVGTLGALGSATPFFSTAALCMDLAYHGQKSTLTHYQQALQKAQSNFKTALNQDGKTPQETVKKCAETAFHAVCVGASLLGLKKAEIMNCIADHTVRRGGLR